MTNAKLISQYHDFENDVIRQFNEHDFYTKVFPKFSKKEFARYVLQLGHLSFEFVKFIERAKLPIKSEIGKEAVREILRDEIPAEGPTHQDNRFTDLIKIGFTPEQILNTPSTPETKKVLEKYYEVVKYPQDNYDLHVLIVLRVIGEVLVGETYKYVVEGLRKHFGLNPDKSLFYTFHWQHDTKGGAGDTGGVGHTEYYDKVLDELIINEKMLKIAEESALVALKLRNQFHEQFLK